MTRTMHKRKRVPAKVIQTSEAVPKSILVSFTDDDLYEEKFKPWTWDTETLETQGTVSVAVSENRKKRKHVIFSEEVEIDVVDWFQKNDILYNKALKGYKDTNRKQRLYEEKASSLDPPCTVQELKTWIESMRTRFGKITEPKKSGAGKLTHRDQWIIETFAFLKPHIVRVPNRQARSKKKRKVSPLQEDSSSSLHYYSDEVVDEDRDTSTPEPGSSNGPPFKIQIKAEPQTKEDEAIAKFLMERAEASVDQQKHHESFIAPVNPSTQARHYWAQYLNTQFQQIDESLWDSYVQNSLVTLMWYKNKSRKLKAEQQQQQARQVFQQPDLQQPALNELIPPMMTPLTQQTTLTQQIHSARTQHNHDQR